jgi:hypothetical protein
VVALNYFHFGKTCIHLDNPINLEEKYLWVATISLQFKQFSKASCTSSTLIYYVRSLVRFQVASYLPKQWMLTMNGVLCILMATLLGCMLHFVTQVTMD